MPEEQTDAPVVEDTTASEQTVSEQTVEPTTPTNNDAPWTNELREAFEGAEDPLTAADTFIREKIQPRITTLEQDYAKTADARELYTDLQENPLETYYNVTAALFGEDVANRLIAEIQPGNDPADPEIELEDGEGEIDLESLPPSVRDLVAKQQEADSKEAFEGLIEDVKGREDVDSDNFDTQAFSAALVAVDGNVENAVELYNKWEGRFKERYAPAEENTGEQIPAPPATLGSDTPSPATPEQPKQYTRFDQLDEAMDDMLNETRPAAPPAVGSV